MRIALDSATKINLNGMKFSFTKFTGYPKSTYKIIHGIVY